MALQRGLNSRRTAFSWGDLLGRKFFLKKSCSQTIWDILKAWAGMSDFLFWHDPLVCLAPESPLPGQGSRFTWQTIHIPISSSDLGLVKGQSQINTPHSPHDVLSSRGSRKNCLQPPLLHYAHAGRLFWENGIFLKNITRPPVLFYLSKAHSMPSI